MPIGHEFDVVVEKRKESTSLRITDTETCEAVVDHTWDLTDERLLEKRETKYVDEGRIGRSDGPHPINPKKMS